MTNPEENKEGFYSQLREVLSQVSKKDKLIPQVTLMLELDVNKINGKALLGHMGRKSATLMGELLLALCSEYGLVITNTIFVHKEHHKVTWMHPRSRHWHLLDYVITRKEDQNDDRFSNQNVISIMHGLRAFNH